MTGGHDDAMRVTTTYLPSAPNRGASGADLVGWLDGWFARVGTSQCEAARTLIRDWYQFPYDFAPCN